MGKIDEQLWGISVSGIIDLGEDEAMRLPGLAGVLPLLVLFLAMGLQTLPQRSGQRDRPAAGLGSCWAKGGSWRVNGDWRPSRGCRQPSRATVYRRSWGSADVAHFAVRLHALVAGRVSRAPLLGRRADRGW